MGLPTYRKLNEEEGAALIVSVLLLIILTLIGTMAMNSSTVEQQIAANDKFHKIVFHSADSGVYAVPKLVAACINTGQQVTAPGMEYLDPAGNQFPAPDDVPGNNDPDPSNGVFYQEIMNFPGANDGGIRDIRMNINGDLVEVDIQSLGAVPLPGGGAEFGTGADGLGYGSTGGFALLFRQDSLGQGMANSASNIIAPYQLITDIPGGL